MEITRATRPCLRSGPAPSFRVAFRLLNLLNLASCGTFGSQPRQIALENLYWRWKVLRTNQTVPINGRGGVHLLRALMSVRVRPCPPRGQLSSV
jgi:hypothetical protein